VCRCDQGVLPIDERVADATDEAEPNDIYDTEKRLLYMACTRNVACWHETDMPPWSPYVRCWGNNRSRVSGASGQLLTHNGLRQFAKDSPRGHKYWQKRRRSSSVAECWCDIDAQC
jgi:hypothetical protein